MTECVELFVVEAERCWLPLPSQERGDVAEKRERLGRTLAGHRGRGARGHLVTAGDVASAAG